MTVMFVQEPRVAERLIAERRAKGLDRHDEVWDGSYVIMPDPNNEHQELVMRLGTILTMVLDFTGRGRVFPGVNVTGRPADEWTEDFRCPDVAVYLNETTAVDRGTHWFGGPDLAIEVVSPNDRTREKLDFYAAVGTRELLVVDREPWAIELFRLNGTSLQSVGRQIPGGSEFLESETVPLSWQLAEGDDRPRILVARTDAEQQWTI